jgi:hypothetical protein
MDNHFKDLIIAASISLMHAIKSLGLLFNIPPDANS